MVTRDSYDYHRKVAFSIADKDSEAAGSGMRDHFRKVEKPYVVKIANDPYLNSGGEGLT